MTPQEKAIIDYHRQSLTSGGWRRNKDGSGTTVLIGGISGPDGRVYMVPMYDHTTGRTLTEDEAAARWGEEMAQGKWPVDDTGEAHNARAAKIHKIIEGDAYLIPAKPTKYDRRGMLSMDYRAFMEQR